MHLQFPDKLAPVFTPPHGAVRYRGAHGGRGSAKSVSFAKMALIRGMQTRKRICCGRGIQKSIKESIHAEMCGHIDENPEFAAFYSYTNHEIRGVNGTLIFYHGLNHNPAAIKSMSNVDIWYIEEAEEVIEAAWRKLIPTVRKANSEIWVVWNPEILDSPTTSRFFNYDDDDGVIVEINFRDNPWFPDVLETERLKDLKRDPDMYLHIWEGHPLTRSDAQIFKNKWIIKSFEPKPTWSGPYYGIDWGFSVDPTAAVKCWIEEAGDTRNLYIEYEAGGVGIELDDIPDELDKIPGMRGSKSIADNARPETISHIRGSHLKGKHKGKKQFLVESCEKWKGSVEDGIEFMRGSFDRIIIHERCVNVSKEFRLYSYKIDRLTEEITVAILDKNNHYIDAIRYALGKMIQRKKKGFFS